MKNIVLIGLSGCGKTTSGVILGQILNRKYIDCDEYAESKYSMSVREMFLVSENFFRDKETACAEEIGKMQGLIVATGGGVILREENMRYLRENGVTIFIDRPPRHIAADIDIQNRPLLKDGPGKIYELSRRRRHLYLKYRDYVVENTADVNTLISKILKIIKSLQEEEQ